MNLLRRLVAGRDDRPLYIWSTRARVAHRDGCSQFVNINGSNRQASRDPRQVRAARERACEWCATDGLPVVPRPTFDHQLPLDATWVWAGTIRTAHRPSCTNVRLIRPEHLCWTSDPDELKRVWRRGCVACKTSLDLIVARPEQALIVHVGVPQVVDGCGRREDAQ